VEFFFVFWRNLYFLQHEKISEIILRVKNPSKRITPFMIILNTILDRNVRRGVLDTTLCDQVCQRLSTKILVELPTAYILVQDYVWRYQTSNLKPQIGEEQTIQWPKYKTRENRQWSTKHKDYTETKHWVTRSPLIVNWKEMFLEFNPEKIDFVFAHILFAQFLFWHSSNVWFSVSIVYSHRNPSGWRANNTLRK
jgi:hypothetical protein